MAAKEIKMKKIAKGKLRSFSISFGLRAGYDLNAPEGDFQIAATAILDWMSNRIESESSYLTGHLVEARTLYAWKDQNGTFPNQRSESPHWSIFSVNSEPPRG